jgi:capsid assembly protease
VNAFDAIADRPWAITEEALRGIVEIATRSNLEPSLVEAIRGEPLDNTQRATTRDGVAKIPVRGPIFRYANLFTRISWATSTAVLATDFRAALDNPAVSSILLEIDSPGGEANGIGELAGMIRQARGSKPIVAYVGGMGASAAYWIASAADRVVASPTAILGSIGALVMIDRRGADEREPLVVVSSQSPEKYHDPESVKGQSKLQAVVDRLAAVFIGDVAVSRGVTADDVMARFGKGGVLVGSDAVDAGLADEIGTLESVMAGLARGGKGTAADLRNRPRNPKEPAMSEPNAPPVAGDPENATISAAEARELRRIAAEAKAEAALAVRARIDTEARAFAVEMIGQARAVPAEKDSIVSLFAIVARDDHAHPLAEGATARQDAVRALFGKRTAHTLTTEKGAGDPEQKSRALGEDPATDPLDPKAADEEHEAFMERTRAWARGQQPASK